MSKNCDHSFLTQHPGTEQSQRLKKALLPENFNLNDFSVEEWMQFAYKFANEVNYFNIKDDETVTDNWKKFFVAEDAIASFLNTLQSEQVTPHLTLFIAFLKLLEFTKGRFNKITQRHLDFYYENILQIEKRDAVEDQVHILFELAKNTSQVLKKEGSLFEAGKDPLGNKMQYTLVGDQVFNSATIESIKAVYHHRKISVSNPNEVSELFAAPALNTKDGLEEPLEENDTFLPFGYPKYHQPENPLPPINLGFAIATPTLFLQEGHRKIRVQFSFKKNLGYFHLIDALSSFEVYATGEKGWLGPFELGHNLGDDYQSLLIGKKFQLALELDKTQEAVTSYDPKIHGENYATIAPLLVFKLKTSNPDYAKGYALYTHVLEKELKTVEVKVKVSGVTQLKLKNDQGDLPLEKPIFPFGTQPVERSSFVVDNAELFQKKWSQFTLKGNWLNTPPNFKEHYAGYRKDGNNKNLSPLLYYQTVYHSYDTSTNKYIAPTNSNPIQNILYGDSNIYVTGDEYFTAKVTLPNKDQVKTIQSNFKLFGNKAGELFQKQITVTNTNLETGQNGPLKFSLNQSFLHSLYPKVYALALSNEEDTVLPNEPYTPFIEPFELDYEAHQEWDIQKGEQESGMEAIQLFHVHPFGQASTTKTLFPTYCRGGELYLGISAIEQRQQLTILFQLLEGTENPLAEGYTFPETLEWAVLGNNEWISLDSTHLIGNTTDNFLKTGIVTIAIPKEATLDNTLLPSGLVWVRVKTHKNFDAFCEIINIHTQVEVAQFKNQNNDLSHLEKGLPAETISKLTQRDALIKKVQQPYHSFGGSPKESREAYYKRVSERLRHKDRAVTSWDYEHLILQQFKDVYKVKCLNHTQGDNYHSAGNVSLVVIPDIVNNNAFDIYQPRLSTAKRNEIQVYINALNSFFVTAAIINSDYEEIEVTTGVKFKTGFDATFYTAEVEKEIKKYLSPWAFEETNALDFGITFHKSKIIQYLEQLEYVDYLEEVIVKHRKSIHHPYEEKVNVLPTSPKAILVSAKKHGVYAVDSKCYSSPTKKATPCLP